MTNIIAIWLGVLILGYFVVDYLVFSGQMTLFLGRKLLDLIEYVAFWR